MAAASARSDDARSDAHLAKLFRDLETDVCDLEAMGLVLHTVVDDVSRQRRPQGQDHVHLLLTVDQETALYYAVNRMLADLRDFKTGYFNNAEMGRVA